MVADNNQEVTTVEMPASERRRYKMLFWVSLVILALFLIFANQWFWVVLPFVLTFYVIGWNFI